MGTKPTDEETEAQVLDLVCGVARERFEPEAISAEQIAGGLGLRRFYRVQLESKKEDIPKSVIARVEAAEDPKGRPAGVPPEPPLEPLLDFFSANKLPVPLGYGGDASQGILFLEDLGLLSMEKAAAGKLQGQRLNLYREALGILPKLQALAPPTTGDPLPCFSRRLDEALFSYKANLFSEHALPVALGRTPKASETQVVQEAFGYIAKRSSEAPQRLAHRDFQSANLYLRNDTLPADIQMIDFQGAFMAPPEYDLVCLLRDSYVELSEAERSTLLSEIRPQLPDPPDEIDFLERFALLTLSRKGKDLARFYYAINERGDLRFQAYIPATVRYLKQAALHTAGMAPSLASLMELIHTLPEEEASCAP
ncbi:MAG: phosphotransferase [Deltaproteobacteria bacterium]|nr:phosphotransferase [Deltaproteobacteria bacterium]